MPEWVSVFAFALAVGAAGVTLMQHRRLRRMQTQLENIVAGTDDRSLAGRLAAHDALLKKHDGRIRELVGASEYLHEAAQSSIRKVSFERYNPFPGVGGNQSFTLVLLDAHNSGVIITSLHNRDATRTYGKAIREGTALQQLSTEEERVFQSALQQAGA